MPTILLLEDNELNHDISRRPERKGYTTAIAVDASLPVLNGWEATPHIRAAGNKIPISSLTVHAMEGGEQQACDDYDTKPVELPRLLAKMEVLLNA